MTMDFMCATFKCATFSAHFNVVKKLLSQLKMAYRRYARRGRGYSRTRKTLSNYRIATRTGAKAQSRQIYALKKRMNAIQRRTKPEICITRRAANPITGSSISSQGGINFVYGSTATIGFLPQLPTPPTELNAGTGLSPVNRFARLLSFTLTGNLNYASSPSTSVTPFALRLVIVQTRATRSNQVASTDVFTDNNPVFGPLQSGVSRTVKVLSDRRYYLTYQRPLCRIKIALKRLMNFYNDSTSSDSSSATSEQYPKGQIVVFYAYRAMTSATEPTGNLNLNLEGKLAYTDA